jgi:hypothetical protein
MWMKVESIAIYAGEMPDQQRGKKGVLSVALGNASSGEQKLTRSDWIA